jgi:hypothetical protein
MATRSTISIIDKEGNGKRIYCHWDGYPSNNGAILLEHYKTAAKIKKLIAVGDISSLAPNVAPTKGDGHTFDNPVKGVVNAYGRDRGEKDVEAKLFYNKLPSNMGEEFDYIFKEDEKKWYVSDHGGKLKLLTKEMCKRD